MAPKPKVADLEAKLKAKEAELEAAQSALVKAEASRAKLKQYLEAFREQAISTTEIINKFKNLQQDYDSLQEKYQQLQQETKRPPTAAAETGTLPNDGAAGASGPDLAVASLEQRLREEQQRGQQLQKRCARLQEEQQAAVREAEQLRREHQQQLQSQGVSGPATDSKKQQDIQQSAQELLLQLQLEQRLNSELRTQLESAVRQQQLLPQVQAEGSPVGGSAAAPRAGFAASSLPLGEAGKAAASTGVAAAVAHTQAIARKGAGGTSASTASRRRRVGGDYTSALGFVAGSAATASGSDSESSGDGNRRRDDGGNLGRASRGQQHREREVAAAQSRWKAAEAALEVTRREVEELRRREAAHKIEMDQLQAQLQALQALVAEHAAALKRHSVHLQQHDTNLQRHELQLERHGNELQLHDNHMQGYNNHLQRHGLQLEQHRDELQRQRHELVIVREGHAAETVAVRGQLEGVVAQLRGINRTHSILRRAFGSSDGGCSAQDGSDDDHGFPGTGALNDASGQPSVGRLLLTPGAASRDGFRALPAARDERGTAAAVRVGSFSKKEFLPQTQQIIQVAIDDGVAAPPGVPSEDDKAGGEQEQAGHHRDKRRRLEESDVVTALGHAGAVGMQPDRVVRSAKEHPQQQQQQHQGQQQQRQGPTVHAHAVTVAHRPDVVDAGAEGKDLERAAAAAPAGGGGGETVTHRQGRGRPRKERIPSELLSTLLDGKATGAGNLTKVAAATARRAAAAIQANTLQPMSLAAAICSAILRCSRDLVGVTAAAANADGGTVLPPPLATAVGGLTTNTARSERGGGSRAHGAGAAAVIRGNGGFLSVLLPSGRSRGPGGPGAATATAAGFGAVTLSDALACLWCEPVEQQRQLVKWLLQVVGDTDRILGDEMTVRRGNGDSAAAVCAAVGTLGGGGSDGAETLRKPTSSHTSLRAAADASPLATRGTDIGAAAAVVEAEAIAQPRSLQVSVVPPSKEPMALLGCLVAQQLNAVACYPLEGGSSFAEAGEAADGCGLQGTGFVHGGGRGGAGIVLQDGVKETEVVRGGAAAAGAAKAPSLTQRCAAAHALGQLFRLYGDREGYQSTALELLHVTADARTSNVPFISGTTTAIAANCGSGQRPAIPESCPPGAVAINRPSAHQTTGICTDCSLLPLCCLFVGWPQALSAPPLLTSVLPAQVQADSQTSPAAETVAPPGHADFSGRRPPLPISTGLGATQGPRVGASHGHVATGGFRACGGLHEGPDDDGDILENLFGDVESEAPHSPPRMGSDLRDMADALVWADPAWEAQLVSEPLGVAIAACGQLLALERLAECCIAGRTSMSSSIREGAGCTDPNSTGLLPTVTTSTVPHLSSSGSVLDGRLRSPVALDGHAEAVAAAVLLRALWEQQQQPSKGPGDQKAVGLLLPGVEEVLLAVGAIQTAMSSTAAVTAIEATLAKGCRGTTDAAVGLQPLANAGGFSKCRGGDGVGGNRSGSAGVEEDPNAVLAAALGHAHFAISELASRLMGLLLTAMLKRQQLGSRRHAHIGLHRQQEQHRYPPVGRAPGEDPSAAAAHCPSGSPAGQSHSHVPPSSMPPSGGAEAAYVANLRQALLLTCHLLSHDQVYDRVLRKLVLWLYPGGPVAMSSAVGSQQQKTSHEAVLLSKATATATGMAGASFADGDDGPAAAADTAASAAGSPLMVVLGMEPADVPVQAARMRSGQPLPTADGIAATVEAAAAKVAVGRAIPCPEACSLDLETVRLVLEVIKDIACQVLGCFVIYHGRGQPFVPASPSASSSPSAPSPVPTTGLVPEGPQALRLACSSLCESLAGLLPALLHREIWGEDLVAAAAQGGEVGGIRGTQRQGAGGAEVGVGEATDLPRVVSSTEQGEGTDAAVATLLSVVAQVAGMCMAGLPLEPSTAATTGAAAHCSAGGDMCWDADAAALGGQAGPRTGPGPTSAEVSASLGLLGEVKARVGRALSAVQQGLLGPVGVKTKAAAAVLGLLTPSCNAGQTSSWRGPTPRPLAGPLAAASLVEGLPMVGM